MPGGIFGHLAGGKRASTGVPSYGMIPPLGSVQSASGLLISQATAMSIAAVMACVRRRAADVARCTPSLYRKAPDGSRILLTAHPIAELLKRPNEQQNWFEFCEQLMIGYLLRQNAYAVIIRDNRGIPVELIPVNPDAVLTLEATTGEIFYNVNRIGLWQIAMLRGFPTAIPEDDIFHLRGITFNALVGASTIGLGRDALGLAMGLEQQAVRWMGAGARPSGILTSDKMLDETAAKRLKAQWEELNAGIINAGKTAVLEDGVKWQQLQMTSVDLQFLPQREFSVLEICRLFGVPPHKVYVTDRAASMNIPQQDQDYFNSTVSPDLVRFEEKIRQVFRLDLEVENGDDGIFVQMDESQLLRADILTRANALRLGILSGYLTQNEARHTENLPPKDGGDVLLVPANTAALGSDATGTAADGAGRPPGGTAPAPGVSTGGTQPAADDGRGVPLQLTRVA
jgi:HK97 family phage portal protein